MCPPPDIKVLPEANKPYQIPITALLALLVFAALYLLRSLDDNRLTSWVWVFNVVSASKVYIALGIGILLAWISLRLPEPGTVALGVISFAVASIFWQEPEAIVDASRYFTQAKHLSIYGAGYFLEEWGNGIDAWTDLPVGPFIYGIAFKVFGESRLVAQTITTAMFSATVVMTARVGGILWNREVGLSGGSLLLAIPYLFTQVPLMLVDVPSMFFLMLALYSFTSAVKGGGPVRIGFASLAFFLAIYSKYSLWPMLSVLIVAWAVFIHENRGSALMRGGAVLALGVLLSSALALYKFEVIVEQVKLLLDYQRPGLKRWTESFTSTFLFQMHPLITVGALYSAWRAIKKRDLRYVVIAWLPALVFLMDIERIRYIIPVFPMYALIAGFGIAKLRRAELRRFVISAAVLSSVVVAVFAYLPFMKSLNMKNLMDSGNFVNGLEVQTVRVVTMDIHSQINPAVSVPLLDIYTNKEIIYMQEAHTPPDFMNVETSPFRFTWRYRNPVYYEKNASEDADVLAVISDRRPEIPEGYEITEIFDKSDGIFRFRTFVTIYQKAYK